MLRIPDLLAPADVLAARANLPELALARANELFAATWQCSHVRLLELVPDSPESLELLLAHALCTSPHSELDAADWLPNTCFRPADRQALLQLQEQALDDIREADERDNPLLVAALQALDCNSAGQIHAIERHGQARGPAQPWSLGVDQQLFWVDGDSFYYLAIHHES